MGKAVATSGRNKKEDENTQELPNMPAEDLSHLDSAQRKAYEFEKAREGVTKARKKLQDAEDMLCNIMQDTGKTQVAVNGKTYRLRLMQERTKIQVVTGN